MTQNALDLGKLDTIGAALQCCGQGPRDSDMCFVYGSDNAWGDAGQSDLSIEDLPLHADVKVLSQSVTMPAEENRITCCAPHRGGDCVSLSTLQGLVFWPWVLLWRAYDFLALSIYGAADRRAAALLFDSIQSQR